MDVLGIDIGGSGIKGAPVSTADGALTRDRLRIETPQPAEPKAVADVIAQIVAHFDLPGPVGVTFPGVVQDGVVRTAANVDRSWIGQNAAAIFGAEIGRPVTVHNDADAAGIAEMSHGAGRGQRGVAVMVTFGTGIGSALFIDGTLVPNTEFGHLEIRGKDAELRAAARIREEQDLSWHKWAKHVDEYLARLEALLSPDMIIIGGGVSKHAEKFVPRLESVRAPIVPAQLGNHAGIVGAAIAAAG
jgi:polyphosphate glucokinase